MGIIPLEEPRVRKPVPKGGNALFALGFRPFYLLAALFAAGAVPLWLAWYFGLGGGPLWLPPLLWHAHEMLFGFACAVIAGFLLTAVRAWTGQPTPTGTPLAALAALWLGGRLTLLFGPPFAGAALDIAFLPLVALALAPVLWRTGNRRNYFVVLLLGALAGANTVFHARTLGLLDGSALDALHLALGLIVTLETVIAGRIVPSFTANALRGLRQWQHPRLNQTAIALTALALLAWALQAPALPARLLAAAAAAAQVLRITGWNPWATRRTPLLWILHLSHAWIPVGLGLLAADLNAAALHVLAVGSMAGLILGMITRTALGHTGRMLVAGRIETAAYGLIVIAVLSRLAAALGVASVPALLLAGGTWTLAFLLYVWRYAPMLVRPRVDGREG